MTVKRYLILNWEEFYADNKLEEGRGVPDTYLHGVLRADFCGQVPFKQRPKR